MKTFDARFAAEIRNRLAVLSPDAQPQWGTMNRGQLIGHIADSLRYTMGEGPDLPFKGNFLSRTVFRFAILSGFRPIPHNVRLPRPKTVAKEAWFLEADLAVMERAMEDYMNASARGELAPRMHAFFGMLSGEQWRRLHYLHFRHHLQQFGIGEGL